MSCEGCFSSQQAIEKAISDQQKKAKEFAVANETNVFLYMDENGQPAYMAEEAARNLGIQPTLGIVSKLRHPNA